MTEATTARTIREASDAFCVKHDVRLGDLATRIGVSQATLSNWREGKPPGVKYHEKIRRILGPDVLIVPGPSSRPPFATALGDARRAAGMTQKRLAERAGGCESTLRKWESGAQAPLDMLVVRRLSVVLSSPGLLDIWNAHHGDAGMRYAAAAAKRAACGQYRITQEGLVTGGHAP